MKRLKFLDDIFSAEVIVKLSNSIIGYNGELEVFAMRGITDFSGYELLDEADWDISVQANSIEQLQKENLTLKLALAEMVETQQADKNEMQTSLTELKNILIEGGYHGKSLL